IMGTTMKTLILMLLIPLILNAQEFTFRQEFDTIPVEIDGWQPHVPWLGGMAYSQPELCDIDADGDQDLFIGKQARSIWFLENIGTPQFSDFDLTSFEYSGIQLDSIYGFAAPAFCDLDGDGDYDLFLSDAVGLIHYWRNEGTIYAPYFEFVTDTLDGIDYPGTGDISFCDIEDDGDFDLFVGSTVYGFIQFYRNEGTPQQWNFSLVTTQFLGISAGSNAKPEFCDIDADGDFDLFVGGESGTIQYFRNEGTPSEYNFTYVTDTYGGIDVGSASSPEFSDIYADGDFDLFVGRTESNSGVSPGDLYLYKNIGNQTQADWQFITSNFLCLDIGRTARCTISDIDADQDQDIFIGNSGNQLSYYENTGDSTDANFLEITHQYQGISVNGIEPFFCDIDADQDQDLFCGSVRIPSPPPPDLYFYGNRGTPQNADFGLVSSSLVQGNFFVSIAPSLADVDADGDYDLFLSDGLDGEYFFYENTGTPQSYNFEYQTSSWQGISSINTSPSFFYDIDNDDDLDLFIGATTGPGVDFNIYYYRNMGTPTMANMVFQTYNFLNFESYPRYIVIDGLAISDFDGDGDGDFIVGTYYGGMLFFRNTTGDTAAVEPRLSLDPLHGIQFSIGPNPANPITWISYNLPYPQKAEIVVYNLLGQKVATLASGLQMPGQKTIIWDAANYASGQYFIKLETEMGVTSDRVVVVK
ncbi:T9SS type A sorting domain-containing protein, partial [bacterium]|nr:T9SS type A sorting domain-containing protein [bacterium]